MASSIALVICRAKDDTRLLDKIDRKPGDRYIVASDDPQVHRELEHYPWIETVCWLENKETFYDVADDVLNLLDEINGWLISLGEGRFLLPKEILYWIRHSEGGFTTQRLQDLLLLVRSYSSLVADLKVSSIVVLSSSGITWEDRVLMAVADSMKVNVTIVGRRNNQFMKEAIADTKCLAREVSQVLTVSSTKFRSLATDSCDRSSERRIVFQLMGWAEKHVEGVLPLMKALEAKGADTVALCWCGEKFIRKNGAYRVRREGLKAVELESYLPLSSLLKGPFLLMATWMHARRRRRSFADDPALKYHGVILGSLLWPSIRHFFFHELLPRYRFHMATKSYLAKVAPPACVKIWGGMSFFETRTLLNNLKDREDTLITEVPIAAVGFPWPYFPKKEHVDIFLAAGKCRQKLLLEEGVSPDQVAIVGSSRYEHITEFQEKFSPVESRKLLNIPLSYDHYLMYDSNKVLRGFMSSREQTEVILSLLSVMEAHKNAALLIKPHPGHQAGMLESMVQAKGLDNVFIVDKLMLPYHAINAADLLLTRISTIGVEAMLFRRPVVPVLFIDEKRFEIYNEASETLRSTRELETFLKSYIEDRTFREAWIRATLEKQALYLSENLPMNLAKPPSVLGAEAIIAAVSRNLRRYEVSDRRTAHSSESK